MTETRPLSTARARGGISALLKEKPELYGPIMQASQYIMHREGALSPAERELIASRVSKGARCGYCEAAHTEVARAGGIENAAELVQTPDDRLRPLFELADAIVERGHIARAEVERVTGAGWPEAAAEEVIEVAALFGFFNRIVMAYGITGTHETHRAAAPRLARSYV